jgi:transcriptional regulator GlxA family with amidase domain
MSAGVSAGTDLGFYLVSRLAGRAVAENAVAAAEYDWHRDPQTPIFYPPQAQWDDSIATRKPREGQTQIEQSALVRVRNRRPTG